MLVKVCGMTSAENYKQLAPLNLNFIGHIYHPQSPRHYKGTEPIVPENGAQRVGVFVNQPIHLIEEKIQQWALDVVQLHGTESLEFAQEVKNLGVKVWKVLHLKNERPDWNVYSEFQPFIDYFLLDYKSPKMGGAGEKFDWSVLESYSLTTPVFLAGGIDANDASKIKAVIEKFPFVKGIDLNSCFEIEPGIKNPELIKTFLNDLQ